jgi:hypothetical protein
MCFFSAVKDEHLTFYASTKPFVGAKHHFVSQEMMFSFYEKD